MAAVSIRFTQETSMVEIPETINLIPKERCCRGGYGVKTTYNDETQTIQRIVANLRLERIKFLTTPFTQTSGCMFQCFDGLGALLHEKLVASDAIVTRDVNIGYPDPSAVESLGRDRTVEFLFTGEVVSNETTNGWCYTSCSKCYRKLQRGFSSFTRAYCHYDNAVGVLRLSSHCSSLGTLSNSVGQIGQIPLGFVAFDGDMTKQTNSCAEEIARLTVTPSRTLYN
ncbi:unnamed protein product [Brassica oleracea]|uniref:(rape) hypothetical protein n=1 Tax=Brassica napus TaxID=3708 RepID=A0A816JFA8_BRANA|nr:unnamed protein product [Brassica napus]